MRLLIFILLSLLIAPAYAQTWGTGREWISLDYKEKHDLNESISDAFQLSKSYPDSAKHRLLSLLKQSWLERNTEAMRKCLVLLSSFYDDETFQEKALQYAYRAIQLSDTLKHQDDLTAVYDNIHEIYFRRSQYRKSFEASLKAIWYARSAPLKAAKMENNLLGVLSLLGEDKITDEYIERCIHTGMQYQDGELWSSALLNKAHILDKGSNSDTTQMLLYLDSGIRVAQRFNQYHQLCGALINKSSLMAQHGRPAESMLLLKAADTLSRYYPIPTYFRRKSYEIAGTAYTKLGNFLLAEQSLLKSLQGANNHDSLSPLRELSRLYVAKGDYLKAYQTHKLFRDKIDTLSKNNTLFQIRDLELQYRTAEKDKQIAENKLLLSARENDLKVKNLWIAIFATGGVLLLCLVFLLRRNFNHKKRILLAEQANIGLKARIEGEEIERKRIASELHDGIGGILSAAKMNLSSIDPVMQNSNPEYVRSVLLLDEAYKELRRTAHNLSPHLLKNKGLAESVFSFCHEAAKSKNIQLKFQHYGTLDILPESIALSTYRIIQELMQNIIKHSKATIAMVQLSLQDNILSITVEDNGQGMPPATTKSEGIGLSNIKDRVKAMNGDMEIDSRINEGTSVYIRLYVHPPVPGKHKNISR